MIWFVVFMGLGIIRCIAPLLRLCALLPLICFAQTETDSLPAGPLSDAIRLGERILTQTAKAVPQYSGNALTCTNCHLNQGRKPHSAPWVGIWCLFPEFRSRNARVNIMEDRINDCFERSMNGRALPIDSDEMRGVLAFMQWISRGVPVGQEMPGRGFKMIHAPALPNPFAGEKIYAEKCALCHGKQGEGTVDAEGAALFPPLWGPRSFNIGSGMARVNTAAAFVKANMPFGQEDTLTEQEAFDVAAFFTHQPRPDFAGKVKDWPRGGKPTDARY